MGNICIGMKQNATYISQGLIFFDLAFNRWCNRCPQCKSIRSYYKQWHSINALKNGSICNRCAKSGDKHPMFGKHLSEETRRKMSKSHIGIVKSEETRRKLSIANTGKTASDATRQKLSDAHKGKPAPFKGRKHTEETKDILRTKCTQFLDHAGISVDRGSKEWFDALNKCGFNFVENYPLKELGYFADGYDSQEHIWMEYDTPYHRRTIGQLEKDMRRQKRIIDHFEKIGNPLKLFIRVSILNNYHPRGIHVVYRN